MDNLAQASVWVTGSLVQQRSTAVLIRSRSLPYYRKFRALAGGAANLGHPEQARANQDQVQAEANFPHKPDSPVKCKSVGTVNELLRIDL